MTVEVPLLFVVGLTVGLWSARKAKNAAGTDPFFGGKVVWGDILEKKATHTTQAQRLSIAAYVMLSAISLTVALFTGLMLVAKLVRNFL